MSGAFVDPRDISEEHVHKTILAWIRRVAPHCMVWHTPNGGSRHLFEAFKLQSLGVRSGVPDLIVIPGEGPRGVAHFLEIKRPKGGTISGEQKAFGREAQEHGCAWAVVTSVEMARDAFKAWGIPTFEAKPLSGAA